MVTYETNIRYSTVFEDHSKILHLPSERNHSPAKEKVTTTIKTRVRTAWARRETSSEETLLCETYGLSFMRLPVLLRKARQAPEVQTLTH